MAKLMLGFSLENFNNFDVFLFKTGIFVFALFMVSVIPVFGNWVMSTHWGWFLGVFVICWIWVMKKGWNK